MKDWILKYADLSSSGEEEGEDGGGEEAESFDPVIPILIRGWTFIRTDVVHRNQNRSLQKVSENNYVLCDTCRMLNISSSKEQTV